MHYTNNLSDDEKNVLKSLGEVVNTAVLIEGHTVYSGKMTYSDLAKYMRKGFFFTRKTIKSIATKGVLSDSKIHLFSFEYKIRKTDCAS